MDEQAVACILSALAVVYSPSTHHETRREAQNYLDSIGETPQAPLIGHRLAHVASAQAPEIRHFGLSLLENAIRYHWNDGMYGDAERAQLRDYVLDIIVTGTAPGNEEGTYIKEKLARMFVEVAKRQWPLSWPQMDEQLIQLYRSGGTQRELSLLILRSLAEDVFVYEDLVSDLRKKTLRAAMTRLASSDTDLKHQYPDGRMEGGVVMSKSASDFGWLNVLGQAARDSLALIENLERGTEKYIQETKWLNQITKTLVPMIGWVLARSLAEADLAVLLCKLLLLEEADIKLNSAECLVNLFSRTFPKSEDVINVLGPILDGPGMTALADVLKRLPGGLRSGPVADDEDYNVIKRFAQAISLLGRTHLAGKGIYTVHSVPSGLNEYLQLACILSEHPSDAVSSTMVTLWVSLLKHESIVKHQFLPKRDQAVRLVPALLKIYANHVVMFEDREKLEDEDVAHYASLDFESNVEYVTAMRVRRQKGMEILQLLVPIMPLECFNWMSERMNFLLSKAAALSSSEADKSKYYTEFDAGVALLEAVASGIPSDLSAGSTEDDNMKEVQFQLLTSTNQLLGSLIQFTSTDPVIVSRQLPAITAFAPMLARNPELLFSAMEKIFTFVTFTKPSERPLEFEDDTFVLRRRASSSLTKLAQMIPDVLLEIYDAVSRSIWSIINGNLVTLGERTMLFECLLAIAIYSSASVDVRKSIFDTIVDPLICAICDENITRWTSDSAAFARGCGLQFLSTFAAAMKLTGALDMETPLVHVDPASGEQMRLSRQMRTQLFFTFNTIYILLKRTAGRPMTGDEFNPMALWIPYAEQITASALAVIRNIHTLVSYEYWMDQPEELRSFSRVSETEIATILGAASPVSVHGNIALQTISTQISGIRSWMGTLRDACYNTLGYLTLLGEPFYGEPARRQLILKSLFGDVSSIVNHHWRGVIYNFVLPYVINCPPQLMGPVLSPFLPALFEFLGAKLRKEWSCINVTANDVDTITEDSRASEEIVAEKILRDFTRAYADFFGRIYVYTNNPKEEKTAAGTRKMDDLQQFLLTTPEVTNALLSSITCLLTFRDTIACTKTCIVIQRMLPILVSQTEYHVFLGRNLLISAMEALNDGYHQSDHTHLNALIADIYLQLRPISTVPYETFALLPGVSQPRLDEFEKTFAGERKAKAKTAVVQQFLQGITGVAQAELGKKTVSFMPLQHCELARVARTARSGEKEDDPEICLDEFFQGIF